MDVINSGLAFKEANALLVSHFVDDPFYGVVDIALEKPLSPLSSEPHVIDGGRCHGVCLHAAALGRGYPQIPRGR